MEKVDHTSVKEQVIQKLGLKLSVTDEEILRKIHFKRAKQTLPTCCASYLHRTFLKTKDVRFFNEFLWVSENEENSRQAIRDFKSQLNEKGYYTYCYDTDLRTCLNIDAETKKVVKNDFGTHTLCLIGSPFHFVFAYKKLRNLGLRVDVINVKYNSGGLQDLLFNNPIMNLFYRLVFGRKNYFEIDIKNKKELKAITLPKNYDVGFHKLGFIIPQNLIDQFNKGLINDHWGALPLFKGRSTLEYSKLFGAKLVVTNHLIKAEIDSGDILCFTPLHPKRLKRDIYIGLTTRIVRAMALLASDSILPLDNTKGKLFYEMHPYLVDYVKRIAR
ncbi:hypothetical protein ACFQZJ_06650 [Maribacter chungangensis]|uniref:Uncharacterized protein n=1 Tax=Maribacter chungangensis TaxID=1069117 RepID=A0ABW3B1C9_9FLAO